MSGMTDKMSKASAKTADNPSASHPKKGEHYRCAKCGMEMQVTADCRCTQPETVHFQCCGQDLQKS